MVRLIVRRVVVGVVAALLGGVLMGATARLMMRLVALAAEADTEFSLGGTAMILTAFVFVTVPGALLASLWHGRGRSLLLIAGALLLAVVATGVASEDVSGVGDLTAIRWVALGAGVAGLYAAIVALPMLTFRIVTRAGGAEGQGLPSAR